MDIQSIILAVVIIVVGYFILRKLPVIVMMTVLGFALLFTSLFVARDMLHLPVNEYVDTHKVDQWKYDVRNYSEDQSKELKKKYYEKNGDVKGKVAKAEKRKDVYRYEYDKLTTESRNAIVDKLGNRVKGNRFEAKLFSMSPYVDMSYEFDNAKMYSSSDGKELIIKFLKNNKTK